jgi:hypothetical protein
MVPKRSLAAILADAASMGRLEGNIPAANRMRCETGCLLREASCEVVKRKIVGESYADRWPWMMLQVGRSEQPSF